VTRVVILGPGASGKSTLAIHLSEITGLPVIELDKVFWRPGLAATPRDQWAKMQERLVEESRWIIDGDLGLYDAVEVRLHAADTIIFLDFSLLRCAWRAIRRSRERADFWLWLLRYRRQSRPFLMEAIAKYATHATLHVISNPQALRRFVEVVRRDSGAAEPPRADE
jgi:adenylate kinase family enzyme